MEKKIFMSDDFPSIGNNVMMAMITEPKRQPATESFWWKKAKSFTRT
jgi:hypothetical protein